MKLTKLNESKGRHPYDDIRLGDLMVRKQEGDAWLVNCVRSRYTLLSLSGSDTFLAFDDLKSLSEVISFLKRHHAGAFIHVPKDRIEVTIDMKGLM